MESVVASEAMKRRWPANIGKNSRDGTRCGNGADNRLLITDQTPGLLSRLSQVRILPGAPIPRAQAHRSLEADAELTDDLALHDVAEHVPLHVGVA